jgi:hypothetical protein
VGASRREIGFFLDGAKEKPLSLGFVLLQYADHSQQIEGAVIFGRGPKNRLQIVLCDG